MAIRDLRNTDLNLYNFVTSGLSNNGYTILSGFDVSYVSYGVYVIDGYPPNEENIKAPCVAIEHDYTDDSPLQLGTGRIDVRDYSIYTYARTKGERDDLSELVKNFFYNDMNMFNWNNVLANGDYTVIGTADFDNIVMRPNPGDNQYEALKHGMVIRLQCNVTVPSGLTLI